MKSKIVDKSVLDLYLKYDEDFTLLDEPWADKNDREKITAEQFRVFGEYLDALHSIKVKNLYEDLKKKILLNIKALEQKIDIEVIEYLKAKVG